MNKTIIKHVIDQFDRFGIIPHTLPNAIGMWPNEQECLVWCVLNSDINVDMLEIGSFCGGSAILIALTIQAIDIESKIISVDNNFNPLFDYNVFVRGKFNNVVQKLECNSFDIPKYISHNQKFGFIFLDGYHSFRSILGEFKILQSHMTNDCIIAFHDVSPNIYNHNEDYINKCYQYTKENFDQLINDNTENFILDEAIAFICKEYQYKILDIPVRNNETHFKETGLNNWVRGTTSPLNSFTAIIKDT